MTLLDSSSSAIWSLPAVDCSRCSTQRLHQEPGSITGTCRRLTWRGPDVGGKVDGMAGQPLERQAWHCRSARGEWSWLGVGRKGAPRPLWQQRRGLQTRPEPSKSHKSAGRSRVGARTLAATILASHGRGLCTPASEAVAMLLLTLNSLNLRAHQDCCGFCRTVVVQHHDYFCAAAKAPRAHLIASFNGFNDT